MSARRHVVITGTGRCGTTFLVELLTNLGLDTGFRPETIERAKFKEARAGLEHDVRRDGCPFVVKDPGFCDYAREVVGRDDITLEHVFIPIRDLTAAAESRRFVDGIWRAKLSLRGRLKRLVRPWHFPGGLWHTSSPGRGIQEEILAQKVYQLMLVLADTRIPLTVMRYPRIATDPAYLYGKLQPLLASVPFESFSAVFGATIHPELVHRFSPADC